ncbi:MAG TPA: HAMP domain-containing histidine kinase [Syntrophomonadaceae bacterium]|nr:HAMP domain-containing histidine kinase [Syntrophomonadaceae bacterium]
MWHKLTTCSKNISLRWQLTVWYVVLMAFTLAVFSTFIYCNFSLSLRHELDTLLFFQGEQILSSVEAENGNLRVEPDLPILPGTYFSLFDATGKIVDTNMPAALAADLPVKNFVVNQPETVKAQNNEWRVLLVAKRGESHARLEIVRSREEIERPLKRLLVLLLITLPLSLVVAAGGGIFLARRALNPIDQIVAKARHISATDLSQRLGLPHSNDEIGRLVTTLDDMLDRLNRAFQRQQQFTADASHELRTPLTVIRSQAETALNKEHTPEEYRQTLRIICKQTEWMGDLVAKLLILARGDSGREQLVLEPVNLADLVEGVTEEFQATAAAKGITLTAHVKDAVSIWGDQTWLTQLLANLVENAIKFTRKGRIDVGLKIKNKWALLWVSDTGVGIPPEHLNHIFERFYRVDKSRSRAEGGFGLGLSICEWVVRSHGGKIKVESQVGRGTTFKVWLPIHAEER